ncbi:MAG: hypothetical protein IKG11_03160 [Atopobiaceae bacterium]|nr:hypothetical protein [Atopobiaceae bacterium]
MKLVNLLVLAQGFETVPASLLPAFEAQLSVRDVQLGSIKEHEVRSVLQLVSKLQQGGLTQSDPYEGFAFSFRIPQISSEFDLLKITDTQVVNIELKVEDVGEQRIAHQLRRNRYYLAPLERTIHTFTYVADSDAIYELTDDGTFGQVSAARLAEVLEATDKAYEGKVEALFKVSNYLVSPINDTDRFLEGSYFLTNHQEQIKANFVRAIAEAEGSKPTIFLVYGDPGTGKSLLLYDRARSGCIPGQACIIHCGVLSEGHELLNQKQDAFRVVSANDIENVSLAPYQGFLVDEAQLLYPNQLKRIAQEAVERHLPLYLSMARRYLASQDGVNNNAENLVRDLYDDVRVWQLSQKIRTNRELVAFLLALFGVQGRTQVPRTDIVKIAYTASAEGLEQLVEAYRSEGYQYLSYTEGGKGAYDELNVPGSISVNDAVGQEFDRVAMVVGPQFNDENEGLYTQLLLQGLTRARDHIALIIYCNEELLSRLLAAFDTP